MKTTFVVLILAGFFNSGALAQSAAPAAHAHWAYEGDHGPSLWAALDPAYATCAKGKAQSPVDFTKGGSGTGNSSRRSRHILRQRPCSEILYRFCEHYL